MKPQSTIEASSSPEQYSQSFLQRSVIIFTFISQFCFAVQTTFITCLLIQYALQSYIDSFVWVIPNIILLVLKPYYSAYLQKRSHSLHTYLNNSIVSLLFAGTGTLTVMISTFPQFFIHTKYWWFYHFIRIILSAIGWTFMDVGLSFLGNNRDKLVESITHPDIEAEVTNTEYVAKILAFLLAFRTCIKSPSWNNFHTIVDVLYLTATFLCFTGVLLTLLSRNITHTIQSLHPISFFKSALKSFRQIPLTFSTFFPGAKHVLPAPRQVKQHLIIKFFLGYINSVIMIYSCIWFVWTIGEHQDELTSSILITGLRFGSIFLALFALNDYIILRACKSFTVHDLRWIIYVTLVFNLAANVLTVMYGHIVYLALLVISGSVLKSVHTLYFKLADVELAKRYQDYDSSVEFIDEIQGIITLSAMPFFWAIIMSDDDMYRPLVGSIVGFVIMILVWVWRGIRPEKGRRSDKEKIE